MNPFEKNTIINTPADLLRQNNAFTIPQKNVILQEYYKAIQSSARKLPKFQKTKDCPVFYKSPEDKFSLTKGPGQKELGDVIVKLNNFKASMISSTKDLLSTLGPPGVSDGKTVARILEIINDVTAAAHCFSSMVEQVNEMIDGYIKICDDVIHSYEKLIIQLQNAVFGILLTIKRMLNGIDQEAVAILFAYLKDPIDILAALNTAHNAVLKSFNQTQQLKNIPKRILFKLNAHILEAISITKRWNRAVDIIASMKSSRDTANTLYLTDNYLDDFSVDIGVNASYDFSVTNSPVLTQYNILDERSLLGALSTRKDTITIDAREQDGTIIVPSNSSSSIISAGLDGRCGSEAQIIVTLEINNGATVIQAKASGVEPNDPADILLLNKGTYITIEYEKDLTYISYSTPTPGHYRLVLYALSGLSVANNAKYTDGTNTFTVVAGSQTEGTVDVIGSVVPPDPNAVIEYYDTNGGFHSGPMGMATLSYALPSRVNQPLHAGEKILVRNWKLSAQCIGFDASTNDQPQFVGNDTRLMFIKANWGFIPTFE